MNDPSAETDAHKEQLTKDERIAQQVCRELLRAEPGYQGTFCFGTPGGNDLDLRLCFADLSAIDQEDIRIRLLTQLHAAGVEVEVDLLYMSGDELASGKIRDLEELGDISERLVDGFDPHEQQAAVGDTSLFSLYIFATMREIDRNPDAGDFGSPEEALKQLELTSEGATGWAHFYTGTHLHDYLKQRQTPVEQAKYTERVAKYVSRVIMGSVLSKLDPDQLVAIKPQLIKAIRAAGPGISTDATISRVLLDNPDTLALLDAEARQLLITAGEIRSGAQIEYADDFLMTAEGRLFYESFQQGIDSRQDAGEAPDSLTSYALGELIWYVGSLETYQPGQQIMRQGEPGDRLYYIPLKKEDGQANAGVDIVVYGAGGEEKARYTKGAGRVVGEGAVFGLPRSATVTTQGEIEIYWIDREATQYMFSDPDMYKDLHEPLLEDVESKRLDMLLRYFAREAAVYTRQTLAYTNKIDEARAQELLGDNPLMQYNMGRRFGEVLQLFSLAPSAELPNPPVTTVAAETGATTLFETGQPNSRLYVVSSGSVQINLQNNETITLQAGEYFGESSILGMPTTGQAVLAEGSQVVSVDARWFKRFTQSRQPIPGTATEELPNGVMPVHLLYHLAAKGYDRVRGRLVAHQ